MEATRRNLWLGRITLVLICLIAGAGCTAGNVPEKGEQIRITQDNLERICSVEWTVAALTVDSIASELTEKPPFVKFEPNGKFGGFASVNRFFGSFSIDDRGKIKIAPVGATMMAGPDDQMAQEMAFLKVFQKIEGFYLAGNMLSAVMAEEGNNLVFTLPAE